tara:strand:+ start:5643 stop:6659 length:1017 start_codon:yes stop_codon:yes gene_type:complete
MGIDLRSSDVILSVDTILSKITDYDIFRFYCPPFKQVGKKFSSELREDPVPSAHITAKNNRLRYIDYGYAEHRFDSIGYVQYKYNVSFRDALITIDHDFNLGLAGKNNLSTLGQAGKTYGVKKFQKIPCLIQVRTREFNTYDSSYWGDYCISKETLQEFEVKPVTHYWINGTRYPAHKIAYAYCEHPGKYKLYSPLKQEGKWFGNMQMKHVQGITMLPIFGKLCLLASSLKDVMCLYELGIPAVALQSESVMPQKKLVEFLKRKFDKVKVLYDNDFTKDTNPGQTMALAICKEYELENICIPTELGAKDISDVMQVHGPIKAISLIKWHSKEKVERKE